VIIYIYYQDLEYRAQVVWINMVIFLILIMSLGHHMQYIVMMSLSIING